MAALWPSKPEATRACFSDAGHRHAACCSTPHNTSLVTAPTFKKLRNSSFSKNSTSSNKPLLFNASGSCGAYATSQQISTPFHVSCAALRCVRGRYVLNPRPRQIAKSTSRSKPGSVFRAASWFHACSLISIDVQSDSEAQYGCQPGPRGHTVTRYISGPVKVRLVKRSR